MSESVVEIPEGSGNWYRYEYKDGKTIYRGPVGSAPSIDESEFTEMFLKAKKRPRKPKQMKVIILERGKKSFLGSVDQTKKEKRHEIIEDATRFFGRELMSTRMVNTLKIRIELRATKLEKDTLGEVGNLLIGSERQRDFTIVSQRDEPLKQQLRTLAHEMVHVRQIAKNELQVRRWKSDWKIHTRWRGEDWTDTPYQERPWEAEARVMGEELAEKWWTERSDEFGKWPDYL